jgi:hypothetical protein
MRLGNSERSSVGGHRADAEIRMRPQHCVTHGRIDLVDDADEAFRSNHWTQPAYTGARAGTEDHCRFVPNPATVQRLGRDEAGPNARAEPNELPEAIVLAFKLAGSHRSE